MSSNHVIRALTQQVKRMNVRNGTGVVSSSSASRSSSKSTMVMTPLSCCSRRSFNIMANVRCAEQQHQDHFLATRPQRRNFSSDNDGGSVDQDKAIAATPSSSSTTDIAEQSTPEDIMEGFLDTSYYEGPLDKPDYSHMTNEELMDTSTIPGWDIIHSPPKDRSIPRGALVGTVVSTKMQKTVNVAVDRFKIHPKYGKRLKFTRKFMAHDENEVCADGDLVMIIPCHRISKHKHFMLREIIRAKGQL